MFFSLKSPLKTWIRSQLTGSRKGNSKAQSADQLVKNGAVLTALGTEAMGLICISNTHSLHKKYRSFGTATYCFMPATPPVRVIPAEGLDVGCYQLAKRIEQLKNLKVHVCGHIHESYSFTVRESDGMKFANASSCDARYRPVNPPILIDILLSYPCLSFQDTNAVCSGVVQS